MMMEQRKKDDKSLLATLLTRGPKAFKKDYDEYLAEKYADSEGGAGNAYAALQSAAADLVVPEDAGDIALTIVPMGKVGKVMKKAAPEAKAALHYGSDALRAERIGLQNELQALDTSTAEGYRRGKELLAEIRKRRGPAPSR